MIIILYLEQTHVSAVNLLDMGDIWFTEVPVCKTTSYLMNFGKPVTGIFLSFLIPYDFGYDIQSITVI